MLSFLMHSLAIQSRGRISTVGRIAVRGEFSDFSPHRSVVFAKYLYTKCVAASRPPRCARVMKHKQVYVKYSIFVFNSSVFVYLLPLTAPQNIFHNYIPEILNFWDIMILVWTPSSPSPHAKACASRKYDTNDHIKFICDTAIDDLEWKNRIDFGENRKPKWPPVKIL